MNTQQLIEQHKGHTIRAPEGHAIKIGNNLADVFTGTGWLTPTRYRKVRGEWVYQHGPQGDHVAVLNHVG